MKNSNKVTQLYAESTSPQAFASGYLKYISQLVQKMDPAPIGKLIEAFLKARSTQNQILFMGNGGSAATASHFANDVGAGPRSWENPFRALSLTDNVAMITAIGNDHGYDQIFLRQLQLYMRAGDVVVGISASGNSPNVLLAIEHARQHHATTVGLTGFDGGKLAKLVDINIHVPTEKGEYGPVEDLHMVVDHLVGAYLMQVSRG